MNAPFIGHVSSCKFIQGRGDIVIIAARSPEKGDEFNTTLDRVTLNGIAASTLSDVVEFVTNYGLVTAQVINPNWGKSGTGFTPCAAIALTALE